MTPPERALAPARWAGTIAAVLTDVEGTTSSAAFVHEVLFPWARERLPGWLAAERHRPEVAAELEATAREAGVDPGDFDGQVRALCRWIDQDRKVAPLKNLQGMIWAAGYASGAFRGHVYPDAAAALRRWHAAGIPVHVFSSGSVAAQKLLFAHTEAGDLRPCLAGHFDTAIGSKKTSDAYAAIADRLGVVPECLLFLSDVGAELDAAAAAGLRPLWLDRPGNPDRPGPAPAHPVAADFDQVALIAGLPGP